MTAREGFIQGADSMVAEAERAATFDHCILAVQSLEAAEARFRAAGFTVTPRGHHRNRGTQNACIMFANGYIELLGATEDCRETFLLEFLGRGEGATAIAIDPPDIDTAHDALRDWGRDSGPPVIGQRDLNGPDGPAMVRFQVLRAQEGTVVPGRLFFCKHLDRPLVFHPDWLIHDNGVTALRSVTIVAEPAETIGAERARKLGLAVEARGATQSCLRAGDVRIEVLSPAALAAQGGGAPAPQPGRPLPQFVEIGLVASDPAQAAAALARAGMPADPLPEGRGLRVPARHAFGVALRIEAES